MRLEAPMSQAGGWTHESLGCCTHPRADCERPVEGCASQLVGCANRVVGLAIANSAQPGVATMLRFAWLVLHAPELTGRVGVERFPLQGACLPPPGLHFPV